MFLPLGFYEEVFPVSERFVVLVDLTDVEDLAPAPPPVSPNLRPVDKPAMLTLDICMYINDINGYNINNRGRFSKGLKI